IPVFSQPHLNPSFILKPAITIIPAQDRKHQSSAEQQTSCLRALKVQHNKHRNKKGNSVFIW
uniref:Uncharacterized protein n=1 Tax=Strix occidentalis caurina TaxID=311401 RepID=A0A8D0FJM8_STROC